MWEQKSYVIISKEINWNWKSTQFLTHFTLKTIQNKTKTQTNNIFFGNFQWTWRLKEKRRERKTCWTELFTSEWFASNGSFIDEMEAKIGSGRYIDQMIESLLSNLNVKIQFHSYIKREHSTSHWKQPRTNDQIERSARMKWNNLSNDLHSLECWTKWQANGKS